MNIVFDFGAVLFAWQPRQLLRQAFPERVPTEADAAALAHQVFGHPDWLEFDRGVLDIDVVIDRISTRLTLPLAATQELVYGIGERLTPMTDTVALLKRLHRRRQQGDGVTGLYYLSNMSLPYARFLETHHAFLACFDGGLFSGDVKLIKPEAAIYQALQQQYALIPEQTLFIDDLLSNVHAAQALGWQGIHFESASQLEAALSLLGL
ncbi:MAG: putative hydrolase of the HAD superfamily [Comamonadaceae bacterium]|nr:MAG: putative hydrolase of the HAD superfamily [Comamonadaceae bacterium]